MSLQLAAAAEDGETPAYVLMVVHCVLIQAHAAVMGGAVPRLLGPAPWGTKGPEQATQEGGSEQPQRSHGHRYLGGAEQKMKVRTPEPRFFQDLTLCILGNPVKEQGWEENITNWARGQLCHYTTG